MPTLQNSSNSEKYLTLELAPFSWTQNWKKTGCCLFNVFFLKLKWGVKRTHSWNGFPTKVICTKKLQ